MKNHESHAKLAPNLMFNGINNGKANEAINFYTSLFPNSEILHKALYEKGEHDTEGNVKYSQFTLNGKPFHLMESSMEHQHNFNEGDLCLFTDV